MLRICMQYTKFRKTHSKIYQRQKNEGNGFGKNYISRFFKMKISPS